MKAVGLAILRWLSCNVLQSHSWTCDAEQGIKPTEAQLHGGMDGFLDYATMYCKHCGKISRLSR
jgi:hypothetical protein